MSDYLTDMFGLKGKTAVLTGGAGTLAGGMARAFSKAGANVILWDVRADVLAAAVAAVQKDAGSQKIAGVTVDLMNEAAVEKALRESEGKFGSVDILVNLCGGNRGKAPYTETKVEDYEFVLKLNLLAGCFLPTKVFAKRWIEKKAKGAIINIASMAAHRPLSGVWAYGAAKAGVVHQTQACAKEFAPHGIRVNAVSPGFFLADQNRRLLTNEDGSLTDRGKQVISRTPWGRFGEPDELCGVILFLASDKAAGFVTGTTIPVDGGFMVDSI